MWCTAEEYLVSHGQLISRSLKESVTEADYSIASGEIVRFAMLATLIFKGEAHAGVAVVTTHRFICCSSVRHNLINASIPFTRSLGIGEEGGLLLKQIPIVCDDVSISVEAPSEHIMKLRSELLDAIEETPNQTDLSFGRATVFQRSAEEYRRVQKTKAAHAKERMVKK